MSYMESPATRWDAGEAKKRSSAPGQPEDSLGVRTEQEKETARLVCLLVREIVHWSPALDALDAALVRKLVPLAVCRARGEEPPEEQDADLPLPARPDPWAKTFEDWRRERDRRFPLNRRRAR